MTIATPNAAGTKVRQAYKFALDPTPAQEGMLRSHAGAARFAWNWGLARCKERYQVERKWYSAIDLTRDWNQIKKFDSSLAWWTQNSKCAYQESFRDLDRALGNFVKSKKGQRAGKPLGFPRFKKRGRCHDSFRLAEKTLRCEGKTVTLPRIGTVRTHESTRKLARRLVNGTARITSATVSRTAQRWFVSFAVEVTRAIPDRHPNPGSAVGVDLGISHLATCVDDAGRVTVVDGPKPLKAALRRLKRAGKRHARTQRGSNNRHKASKRLARVHARVANQRTDAAHKLTTPLAREYETVVVEDLNVTGMLANGRLARALSDQGFGQVRRQLGYKTEWNGGRLVVADRWYPSSKTCSACGGRKPSLSLAERTYHCENCGHAEDRDVNAARNLLQLAASGAERQNACGDRRRPRASGAAMLAKQEPGTALDVVPADQTGAVDAQASTP